MQQFVFALVDSWEVNAKFHQVSIHFLFLMLKIFVRIFIFGSCFLQYANYIVMFQPNAMINQYVMEVHLSMETKVIVTLVLPPVDFAVIAVMLQMDVQVWARMDRKNVKVFATVSGKELNVAPPFQFVLIFNRMDDM